jgi:hypothetical protein
MTFAQLVGQIIGVINSLVVLLIGVAFVVFLWGCVRFLYKTGDTTTKAADRDILIWGLVAMFVCVSVWGILGLACSAFFGNLGCAYTGVFGLM